MSHLFRPFPQGTRLLGAASNGCLAQSQWRNAFIPRMRTVNALQCRNSAIEPQTRMVLNRWYSSSNADATPKGSCCHSKKANDQVSSAPSEHIQNPSNTQNATLGSAAQTTCNTKGTCASSTPQPSTAAAFSPENRAKAKTFVFWSDTASWRKASFNTLNCLIGCSIGDLSTMMVFQTFFPEVSMVIVMPLAMLNGILTSISLETIILKYRNTFSWRDALRVAIRMSLISMITMELAENFTDLYLWNKGHAYWGTVLIGLVAGFLTPLPYNYYMLRTVGRSCH